MRNIFFSLLVTVAISFSSWSIHALEKTATEVYLGYGHEFKIKDTDKIIEYLFKLIAKLEAKDKSAKDFLLLGDAYHWLGHIAEDSENRIKAEIYYKASYMAYKQTPITNSERINNLNGVKHALYHLSKNANLSIAPEEFRMMERVEHALHISEELAKIVSKFTEADLKEQADNIDGLCAKYLVRK